MPTEAKIRLLVADDQDMVRQGVKALLAGTEIKVVAEVATGQAAVKHALETEVDVVLLDVRMPDGDGLTALGRIKLDKPNLPVLLFSAFDNPASVARAIALGASGFLLKDCSRDELVERDPYRGQRRECLEPRKTPQRERGPENAPAGQQSGSLLERARGGSSPPDDPRTYQQADRPSDEYQLRDRQGTRPARLAEDRADRSHPGRGLGGEEWFAGLKNRSG